LIEVQEDKLDEWEIKLILKHKTHMSVGGYNMTWGGTDCRGEKNPFYGRKHSEETKKQWSEKRKGTVSWNKGVSPTDETKAKIAETLMGNKPWNLGVKASEEHRKNLSVAHMGIVQSEETKAKRADSLRGLKRTEAQKKTMSDAATGRKNSDEHKQACSEGVKALWADPVYRAKQIATKRLKRADPDKPTTREMRALTKMKRMVKANLRTLSTKETNVKENCNE